MHNSDSGMDPHAGRPAGGGEKRAGYKLPLLLFLLTVLTTLIAGSSFSVSFDELLKDPLLLAKGIPFAFSLLSILLAHEMGHFITSRRYRVDVTLPYFIPAPTLFGTLGAVIKMKSPIHKKTMLLDIGAAGPLAGITVAVPLVVLGLSQSQLISVSGAGESYLYFGDSLLFKLLSFLVIGKIPDGYDIMLSPVAFAGWVGFLVTALNLMPMGQLDGGHISYALFGRGHRIVSRAFVGILISWDYLLRGVARLGAACSHHRRRPPAGLRQRGEAGWETDGRRLVLFYRLYRDLYPGAGKNGYLLGIRGNALLMDLRQRLRYDR